MSLTWFKSAGIRAIKTIAQTAIATIGTELTLGNINLLELISISLTAGFLSILTSLAGLPEVKDTESNNV